MKSSTLLAVVAVVGAFYGVALLVAPVTFMEMYAVAMTPAAAVMSRLVGAHLLGFAVINWLGRGLEGRALRGLLFGNLVVDALGGAIVAHGVLTGVSGPLGWTSAGLYALFVAGFGYALMAARPTAAAVQPSA